MTFASMSLNENPAAAVAKDNNNPAVSVKVSFGNDIRRVTFNGASFTPLRDVVAALFVLDPAAIVVKYQDEDEDKITMSSDGELQEALRLSKGTLRLFVENKPALQDPAPEDPAGRVPGPHAGQAPFMFHGPFRGHHGFGHHGHHGFGHHGHHGPRFGPWGPASSGRGGFGSRGGFGGFGHHGFGHQGFGPHGGFGPRPQGGPAPAESPAGSPPCHTFGGHPLVAHGEFSPAVDRKEAPECPEFPLDRQAWKERKMAFKQTVAAMKAHAATKDDLKAIKKYKEEMKEEFKSFKKQHEKREKREKKYEKYEKHAEKAERLMARHVADVTIPDNSELPPDTAVVKTWRIKNVGTIAWPPACQLRFISHAGDQLSGPERVVLEEPVFPQQEVDVSVPLLTPGEPGRYVGYYRMATPDGVKFGQRVWVSFVILPTAPANTTAATAPAAMDQ